MWNYAAFLHIWQNSWPKIESIADVILAVSVKMACLCGYFVIFYIYFNKSLGALLELTRAEMAELRGFTEKVAEWIE